MPPLLDHFLSLFLVCTSLISMLHGKPESGGSTPKKVIVFGGNGFMGSATVEALLAAGHVVTIVNRGNWYWDSDITVKPHVQQVTCDRGMSLQKCDQLVEAVNSQTFDVAVDFSAYHPFAISEAVKLLRNQLKLYIYISSDSVYEVCEKSHSEPSRETDAVRPEAEDKRKEFAERDDYGHRKLQCEEELRKQRENDGIPYVSLRLPDVIGPRDNTYRWWVYQMWLRLWKYLEKPVYVPAQYIDHPMSFVFSNDVATIILSILDPKPEVLDQAYNLAFRETPSLLSLLNDMKMALNVTEPPIKTHTGEDALHLFPSVRLGPVDVSKATDHLGWNPTPWEEAVHQTVDFYESAVSDPHFDVARKDIIRTLQTHFTSRPFKVLLGIRKEYGYNYQGPDLSKDEL